MEKAPLTSTRVPQAPMPPVPRDAATEAALPHDDVADVPLEMATGNKKKKKKGKRADSDASLAVSAQVQADLLTTASDLYRRIETDPHGFLYDEAYWSSLPTHLRTFIRNALPLGHMAPDATAPRHTSTQTMIAVAQQLAQAAHASQRLNPGRQYPGPGPFDAGLFADVPLPLDAGRRMPRPSPGMQAAAIPASTDGRHGPVVLVDELDDDADFEDECVDDDLDADELELERLAAQSGALVGQDGDAPKKKKNRKKKRDVRTPALPLSKARVLPNAPPVPQPPPSSRAAGKLPMTFSGRAPPRAPIQRGRRMNANHALYPPHLAGAAPPASGSAVTTVSYTHLTLPTKRIV